MPNVLPAVFATAAILGVFGDNEEGERKFDWLRMRSIVEAQPSAAQARFEDRHPYETLRFFDVGQGMTVVEVTPGDDGFYTRILIDYLGAEGRVMGADYASGMWSQFSWANEDWLAGRAGWADEWTDKAQDWRGEDAAAVSAMALGAVPAELNGTVDLVLFIRTLHNLTRLQSQGGYLSQALAETYALLKPGGVVGVVQHRAPDDADDGWAMGAAGYLKEDAVIAVFEAAGFEFVDSTNVNQNKRDRPKPEEGDTAWRLPPLYAGVEDEKARRKLERIGETDRMTLKFRKPAPEESSEDAVENSGDGTELTPDE